MPCDEVWASALETAKVINILKNMSQRNDQNASLGQPFSEEYYANLRQRAIEARTAMMAQNARTPMTERPGNQAIPIVRRPVAEAQETNVELVAREARPLQLRRRPAGRAIEIGHDNLPVHRDPQERAQFRHRSIAAANRVVEPRDDDEAEDLLPRRQTIPRNDDDDAAEYHVGHVVLLIRCPCCNEHFSRGFHMVPDSDTDDEPEVQEEGADE